MKTLATAAATLSLLLAPLAEASPKNGRGNGNGNGNGNGAWATGEHCPPGLAGRNPACVPPGQAGRGDEEARRADSDERGEAEDVIEVADNDDDRDTQEALAIVGTLAALALIERARRNAEEEAAAAPAPITLAPAPPVPVAPSFFSFSEVPSRPSSLQTVSTPYTGDATDLESFTGTAGADNDTNTPEPVAAVPSPEPVAPTADRLVPLSTLPAPVPTPQEEEALLSDVFRRAANEGDTGF